MGAVALSVLQTWMVIELFFLIGTDGRNRFGADPTRNLLQGSRWFRTRSRSAFRIFFCSVPVRSHVVDTWLLARSYAHGLRLVPVPL